MAAHQPLRAAEEMEEIWSPILSLHVAILLQQNQRLSQRLAQLELQMNMAAEI